MAPTAEKAPFLDHDDDYDDYKHTNGHGVRGRIPLRGPEDKLDLEAAEHPRRSLRAQAASLDKKRVLFTVSGILLVLLVLKLAADGMVVRREKLSLSARNHYGPMNSTLGFGAVLLLTLPERTDRQDGMSLISALSDIDISATIPGVHGDEIAKKARPFGNPNIMGAPLGGGYLGSWRSHMNALRYVIDNRLETALLLEDDVDWDVRIKPQMAALSRGFAESTLRNLSSPLSEVDDLHPYGLDWDILHLGAAIIHLAPDDSPAHLLRSVYKDENRPVKPGCLGQKTPPFEHFCWDPLIETLNVPSDSRAIVPTHDNTGLPAIAVTYEGAQKILYQLSWVELKSTIDFSLAGLLVSGLVQGWSILPPLFSQFKVGGKLDSDLDFGVLKEADQKSNLEGSSFGLEQSARKALTTTLAPEGQPNRWAKEHWEDRGVAVGS